MITANHARILGMAIALLLGHADKGSLAFVRSAVRTVRHVGHRSVVPPFKEFDLQVEAGQSSHVAVAVDNLLGIWAIAYHRTPRPADLELSSALGNRLLFNRERSLTPNAK